jgi:hypothetical protein
MSGERVELVIPIVGGLSTVERMRGDQPKEFVLRGNRAEVVAAVVNAIAALPASPPPLSAAHREVLDAATYEVEVNADHSDAHTAADIPADVVAALQRKYLDGTPGTE